MARNSLRIWLKRVSAEPLGPFPLLGDPIRWEDEAAPLALELADRLVEGWAKPADIRLAKMALNHIEAAVTASGDMRFFGNFEEFLRADRFERTVYGNGYAKIYRTIERALTVSGKH